MTQTILKALMRLFAIVSHVYPNADIKLQKQILESYLKLFVRDKEVYQYSMMFDFYLKSLKQKANELSEKKISLYSVKSLLICEEINKVLQQDQKVITLLYILEIAFSNRKDLVLEYEFLNTIADALKIENEEFVNTTFFVLDQFENIEDKNKILFITANPMQGMPHQIINENLMGKIVVLHYTSCNTYILKHVEKNDMLYLNNREIIPERCYIFDKGSLVHNPKVKPIYYSEVVRSFLRDITLHDFTLSAIDVEYYFNNSTNGIQNLNFSAISGQLIGIMGGSGVGKSTFLNVINGSLKPNVGRVLINGYDIHQDKDKIIGLIGFIPQDDLLIEELTVYENLYFNARLCFNDLLPGAIEGLVNKTLGDLGLYAIKDLVVGNPLKKFISGGQRKRLNIALELIREPFILLVDEPTSGLSSRDSDNVMDLFKEQALKGKIVIINIHQPSSNIFKMFDKLLVFDEGGRAVYNGNPVEGVVYFKNQAHLINANESECLTCGNVNPEQILDIVEAKTVDEHGFYTNKRAVSATEWYSLYKKNIETNIETSETKKELPQNQFRIPGKWKQFKIFSLRNTLTKLSDKQYLLINLLEAPLLALILGFFTKNIMGTSNSPGTYVFSENENIPAYLFMSIIVALFLGMMVSAEEIIKDRRILKRESFLNLSWNSYLNSKIIILFGISAIQTLLFVLIGNMILGIRGMYFSYWAILFSTSCFANMLGLNISAALKSVVSIYISIPLLLVPQLLFAGVIVKFDKLHPSVTSQEVVPLIGDIMVSRWAYEALAVNQFKNNAYQKYFYEIESFESNAAFNMNYYIPELITKAYFCKKYHDNPNYRSIVSKELGVLQHEMKKLLKLMDHKQFGYMGSLTISSFNNEVAQHTLQFLDEVKRDYAYLLESYIYSKDTLISNLIGHFGNREAFFRFKNKYYNNSLADQVLNKMEKVKITEVRGRLVQKAEPIYKEPQKNNGRAHFFAPEKKMGGMVVQTLGFNMVVIWLFTLFFYLALQFNLLKRAINSTSIIKNVLDDFLPVKKNTKFR
jgi:ABC transport system ATP-binding/permease protein